METDGRKGDIEVVVANAREGDGLRVRCKNGAVKYAEARASASGGVEFACAGADVEFVASDDGEGVLLREVHLSSSDGRRRSRVASEVFVRAYEGWASTLDALAKSGTYPKSGLERGVEVDDVEVLCNFYDLRERVKGDASFWADGSPPNFAGISADERATLNAGEILAFACGARPMCMVQLWSGWNDNAAIDQNVDLPFVTRLLKEMAEDDEVGIVVVAPPGASERTGLTALLFPNKSPYKERAKLLASFGAQAALVAGSPYYQTLIGRCLGYKEDNIRGHVAQYNKGAGVSEAISELVERELSALSAVKVEHRARWRDGYGTMKSATKERSRKPKRSTSNVENVEMMFGRRRPR